MKQIYIIILFLFFYTAVTAQQDDTPLINALIKNIASAQVSADGYFYKGTFPSFRKSAGIPHNYQPDNNIFFTAIAVFALQNMLPQLTGENKKAIEKIIRNAQPAFPLYRDKDGFPYYNFWPTGKGILPRTYFMKYFNNAVGMGEDADDAVMSLMATSANDSICTILKQRMIATSNGSKRKIISTYKKYRNIPAYCTYLGFGMKPDFDLGVHCNLLYFMLDKKLPLVKQDSASIELLAAMIRNREYMKVPVFISPYYARSAVLLYHIARLMGRFNIPQLEQYKPQLINDIQEELSKTTGLMDKIILSTSLLRLGVSPTPLNITGTDEFEKSNQDKFIFFQARAAFSYPLPLKQVLLHFSYFCYYFYSPAYNKILLLEYLMERNKH